jgi:hypothetical protein
MTATLVWQALKSALKCAASLRRLGEAMTSAPTGIRRPRKAIAAGLAALLATTACGASVLSPSDFQKVQDLKPMFLTLMDDLVQTAKRTDISRADAECVQATIQELLQIGQEFSSYESLITIEKDLIAGGDDSLVREATKFAVDKSNSILSTGRKRLVQLSDQCARLPLSFSKTQQALQVIDVTSGVLNSVKPQ